VKLWGLRAAHGEKRHKRVEQVGQVVLLREDTPGFAESRPGILLIEVSSARRICLWKASYGGEWEAARACARALSHLTDWRAFNAFSAGQRRAAGIRLGQILSDQRVRTLHLAASPS
jgi:hypothetical protein